MGKLLQRPTQPIRSKDTRHTVTVQPQPPRSLRTYRPREWKGRKVVKTSPKGKAAGVDGITTEAIHECGETGIQLLTTIFQKAWEESVTARVCCRGGIDRKKRIPRSIWLQLTVRVSDVFHKPLFSHWTSQQTIFFTVQWGTPKYILKNYNNIIPRLTLLMETFIHTYNHSFTVLSAKSINTVSLPWKLSDFLDTFFSSGTLFLFFFSGDLLVLSYFNSWVSTPPSQLGWSQDAPAWVCRPSSLQHLCFHSPGSTFWSRSRLLPITHAQLITSCPFNLSVGQSCLHFISPLISNYSHQYPKSHNLGFHQHPLHDTNIKSSQLALNSSPPYNQTILSSQSKHHVHNW